MLRRRSILALVAAFAGLAGTAVEAANTAQWKSRTIYQVLTDRFFNPVNQGGCNNLGDYCGGTWRGIIDHLDYIQSMGFDAIWISPMPANAPGGYHGYWQTNMYQPNPYFGTAGDLKALSTALKSRGMYLMLDIVGNHQAPVGSVDISQYYPFNNQSAFHDCNNCPQGCNINNYTDLVQMEHCRLAGLMDLNQTNPFVGQQLIAWINNITTTYAIDGLRVDTLPYVFPSYWSQFFASLNGMYAVGEVFDGDVNFVSSFQKQAGIPATLSYPMFFTLRNVFAQQQSMTQLQSEVQQYASSYPDVNALATFVDNHDNPRFLNLNGDQTLYQNALLWVLLSNGVPIIYYGTEAGFNGGNDPNCREVLWTTGFTANGSTIGRFITTVNAYRKQTQIWNQVSQVQRYADNSFYAFTRGQSFVALTNVGQNGQQQTRTITYHPYSNGQKLCNLFNPNDCVTVSNGQFQVQLNNGMPKVYDPSITGEE